MSLVLFLLQSQADLIAVARTRTAAEERCKASDTTDVTVCGRRNADRFRAPLVTRAPGRRDDVAAERTALLHRTNPVGDLSPFLVGGGMVGLGVGIGVGGRTSGERVQVRPLAP